VIPYHLDSAPPDNQALQILIKSKFYVNNNGMAKKFLHNENSDFRHPNHPNPLNLLVAKNLRTQICSIWRLAQISTTQP
jgi:hypothetical protein